MVTQYHLAALITLAEVGHIFGAPHTHEVGACLAAWP